LLLIAPLMLYAEAAYTLSTWADIDSHKEL
jgi:hypothetical protein